ncbi:MAG: adenine deaminase [Spirochaetales bacterium]|nr:adenine deaminase [Spirochaetales bacterium]
MNNNAKDILKRKILVASGKKKCELVFRNAKIVDVFSHEIVEGSIGVDNGRVVGIGLYEGTVEIDVKGRFIMPGLIDSHVHIESSLAPPDGFARAVIPHGTTTVIADPHEIANVKGAAGIKFMSRSAEKVPMNFFFMIPSCVPATSFEHSGAVLDAVSIDALMDDENVLGLGELMDYPSVVAADDKIMDKILTASNRGKLIDGHGPMLEGKSLNAYAAAGVRTDHESSTVDEMRERLRAGMYILMREGSAAHDLDALLAGVTEGNSRRCMFCTDDRQPEDILKSGHIDNHLRISVKNGIDPITAVQMATINSAQCYRLNDIGAVATGYKADFVVVDDLKNFKVREVYYRGNLVAKDGKAVFEAEKEDISSVSGKLNVKPFKIEKFKLKIESDIARVMRLKAHSLLTEKVQRKIFRDKDGNYEQYPELDIIKLAVIERHNGTGNIGLGLIENFKLQNGAIATTIAHDSHNIIVTGDNDADMYSAVAELIKIGGGITLCSEGKILGTLHLPIAGLMSDKPLPEINEKLKEMNRTAYEVLKVNRDLDPFMTLAFMALPVIPELKLTDVGLFDVAEFRFTDISV